MADASRPPNRFGQVIPARPASAFLACQALQRSTASTSSPPRNTGRAGPLGSALAAKKDRASARKAASSGVSLKSICVSASRIPHLEQIDYPVLPPGRTTERQSELFRSPVIQMAIHVPREANATM